MTFHRQEDAQDLAIRALGWIAGDDEIFAAFLGATGADLAGIRQRAQDPAFLAAVLDFLLMQDEWVLGFCRDTQTPPEQPMQARAILGGGDMRHWT